jgi:hypothetical protein
MSLYVIGIGGSGAKCIEAIAQLASTGLFDEQPIKVAFVDADETNGNLERSRNLLSVYKKNYDLLAGGNKQNCPWMKTKIESFDLWSPLSQLSLNKQLGVFFNYNTLKEQQPNLANLFDVLYTQQERETDLDYGFRGRPAIGSAVMSQIDLEKLDQEPWASIITQIQVDVGAGKTPKVFLCGSMFGGTGAAGLPTIGRLISNKLQKLNVRDRVSIASLFLLPYFGFSSPPGEDAEKDVFARSEQFLLNTEAALRYYTTQARGIFDTVYLLGNHTLSQVDFSIGKNSQRNGAHFIELYAGLAARRFLLSPPSRKGEVVLISRDEEGKVAWDDLPELSGVRDALVNATRFAYTWLTEFVPELMSARNEGFDRYIRSAPWLIKFYQGSQSRWPGRRDTLPIFDSPDQQEAISTISNWCRDYLRWLGELHQCDAEAIQLFRSNLFKDPANPKADGLSDLIDGDTRDQRRRVRDTPKRLKERLKPNQDSLESGTVGLAKELYVSCKLD